MGDRANVVLKQDQGGGRIYLYTHNNGTMLPKTLQDGLIRGQGRWGDCPYLGRIIFSEMIKNTVMSETGYGIATYVSDNEAGRPLLVVDMKESRVELESANGVDLCSSWSFSEYCAIDFDGYSDPWLALSGCEPDLS